MPEPGGPGDGMENDLDREDREQGEAERDIRDRENRDGRDDNPFDAPSPGHERPGDDRDTFEDPVLLDEEPQDTRAEWNPFAATFDSGAGLGSNARRQFLLPTEQFAFT